MTFRIDRLASRVPEVRRERMDGREGGRGGDTRGGGGEGEGEGVGRNGCELATLGEGGCVRGDVSLEGT
jgi:hypothetical protein